MILINALVSILLAAAPPPEQSTDLGETGPVTTAPPAPTPQVPAPGPTPSLQTPPPAPTPAPPATVDTEAAIRAAYQNAENQQGPLDGRWRLTGVDDMSLFVFVLTDTGGAPSARAASPSNPAIEGAWRDLRRGGAVSGSGLLLSVQHIADTVEIRFYEADPAAPTVITLHADAGGWSGELFEAGVRRPVVMKRF